ncbi:MAG TPA: cytochrome d ubiquinol oxidase subunit II [Candidatus Avirikenella pullistercoris]|nr:cytochrome d ubiquinol oxidase subunit II [Candidatus Avirikenella pullistercoris]
METYALLQHYWWFIISLLGGILVFLLFIQGGQTLIYTITSNDTQKSMVINSLGHKWELTFTTLVTFGGAFFASFPLFYSTSFGGAFYVWMAILFFFVIQAVAYEYRIKPDNLLGQKTYEWFLILNGLFGTILLGTAVGTLFTGAEFTVARDNIGNLTGNNTISQWQTPWRGLEAVTDYRNIALGLAVFFLARVLAIHYFYNNIRDNEIAALSKRPLLISSILFVALFLTFLISLLFSDGMAVDPANNLIHTEPYKYLHNFIEMPVIAILFLIGVISVLWGIWLGISSASPKAIWFSGTGTVVTVTMLLLTAGFNNTAYYPSLADMQSSLTIYNSSSSEFTLKTMAIVSILIPFVLAYIWYAWKAMNKKPITAKTIEEEGGEKY